jgi:hypothetical protein
MATKKRVLKKFGVMNAEEESKRKIVRIGARIDHDLYILCRMAYNRQGISMESRIEELLKRDVDVMSKNQWFKDMMKSELLAKYVIQANSGVPMQKASQEDDAQQDDNQFGGKYDIGGEDDIA